MRALKEQRTVGYGNIARFSFAIVRYGTMAYIRLMLLELYKLFCSEFLPILRDLRGHDLPRLAH